jgi:FixJ family two-component response regulator
MPKEFLVPFSKQVVAIVDDDAEVRASISSLLRSAGWEVRDFRGAEDLLASAELGKIGCLITDVQMPGMNGLALQSELKNFNNTLPVIVLTAFPTDAARDQALKLGAVAFMKKPLDPDALLSEVEGALK